jgi:hypothetical protein
METKKSSEVSERSEPASILHECVIDRAILRIADVTLSIVGASVYSIVFLGWFVIFTESWRHWYTARQTRYCTFALGSTCTS